MPKQRKKRKPVAGAPTQARNQNQVFPRWIRISAVVLILMLMLSALVGAIASAPAKAASLQSTPTVSFSPLPTCAPIDTDHDGIPNNIDQDIDGDGIVNGKDPDIDGDGIPNAQDPDPASTNCDASTTPPLNVQQTNSGEQFQSNPWRIPVILLIGAGGVGYIVLRRRRGQKAKSDKVD